MKTPHACAVGLAACLAGCGAALAQPPAATRHHVERIGANVQSAKLERVAVDRARLSITPKIAAPANLRLFDNAGKEVPVTRSRDGAIQAEVDPRRGYVLAPTAEPRRALPKDGIEFPARYVTFSPQGAANLGGLFLRPARIPLTWNDESRAYTTELFVGYEFLDGAERPLGAPKTVTFFAEGSNVRIQADTVVVKSSGVAGYQRVTLFTHQLEGETLFTARAGPADELKSSATIFRQPGALKLSLPSSEIPAFGVGTGTVTVSLLARDGMPLAAAAPLEILLSSRRLRQPPSITLPPGQASVDVAVRSVGFGTDEITAEAGMMRASQPVEQVFPVAALVAALIGGALGGTARYVRNRGRRRALLTRRTIEGVLVAIILVGAAWAGFVVVDMSAGVLGTPFGAFVLAALGGYVGCVLLDRVAGKAFGGLKLE